MMIEDLARHIPTSLLDRSGKVFYSGRLAFGTPSELYMLGVNPGGGPQELQAETVASHSEEVLQQLPDDWSAYRDESWSGKSPGTRGMQPRVLHLLRNLSSIQVRCQPAIWYSCVLGENNNWKETSENWQGSVGRFIKM